MPKFDDLERVNLETAALADRIARKRERVEKLDQEGKDATFARSALAIMTDIFLRRLKYRQLVSETRGGSNGR